MSTIQTSCSACGDVRLPPAQFRLIVCTRVDRSYYAFDCPHCHDEVRKPADEAIIDVLIAQGAVVERWVIPLEALEAHHGATIAYDEVLDFALSMDRIDIWTELTPSVGA